MTDSLLGVRYVLDTQQPAGASQALFSINLPAPYGTAHAYQTPTSCRLATAWRQMQTI